MATAQPGLEPVLDGELRRRLGRAWSAERCARGMLRSARALDAAQVVAATTVRTADDLYAELWHADGGAVRDRLSARALAVPGDLQAVHRQILAAARRTPSGRFKVTCFLSGRADLRRRDIEAQLASQVRTAHPGWRLDADHPDAEVVMFVRGDEARAALRLTDPSFRHRGLHRARAALSPTVAAAMVHLSGPEPADRFLDPCCGGGTILLERAAWGPYRELIGGDADPEALAVARDNFGSRHRPWRLDQWDARRLPLPDASVDRMATNLPFGVQVAAEGGPAAFAGKVLSEAARVLRPGGRAVVLAAEPPDREPDHLARRRALHVELAGRSTQILIYARRSAGDGA